MRILFFVLLFANLAYLGWAGWVDVPQPAPVDEAHAKLPRLNLVGEKDSAPQPAPSQPGAAPPAATTPETVPPAANTPDAVRKTSLVGSLPQAARCLSIGPFGTESEATAGAAKLRERGLNPRRRDAEGEVPKGFWVYIGGLKGDRDVADVLRVLGQSHVDDAHAMPPQPGSDRKVSVGLFSERDRAEKRALALRKLSLHPEVEPRRVPGTVFWMDVDVPPGAAMPAANDFAAVVSGVGAGGGSASDAGGAGPSSGGGGPGGGGLGAAGVALQAVACPGSGQPVAAPLAPASESSVFRTKVATGTPKMP